MLSELKRVIRRVQNGVIEQKHVPEWFLHGMQYAFAGEF